MVGTRRIAHVNATAHPTADWTLQQFREVLAGFLVHDRDSIYSSAFDSAVEAMGLSILKTPFRAPQANAFCERLIGSIRRECLDFLIPLNDRHLRGILKEWVAHYNKGRPHSGLGPGKPEPSRRAFRCRKFQVTELVTLSWVVCITNIDWNQWRHEKGENPEG
jgi:transposase InsO family protein